MTPLAATAEIESEKTTPAKVISDNDRRRYLDEGYLIVRNFYPAARMATAAADADAVMRLTELMSTDNIRCRWQDHVETGVCTFDAFDPILDLSPACADLATDPRLIDLVGALYGEPACLFKDKLIFKPPGAKGYALHQDYISWPTFPKSFLTVVIAIDACNSENGCTEIFSGYHHSGNLSASDGDYHELPADSVDSARSVKLLLNPGDLGIFSGFTPHRSAANRSDRWRRQLYLSYNAMSDGGHQRDQHYREFHAWLAEKYAQYGKTGVYFR